MNAKGQPEGFLDLPALVAVVAGLLSLMVSVMPTVHTMLIAGVLAVVAWFSGAVVLFERPAARQRYGAWIGLVAAMLTAAHICRVYVSAG